MPPFNLVGPHLRGALSPEARTWARNCNYVKALDDGALLDAASPTAITSFRVFLGDNDQQYKNHSPQEWLDLIVTRLKGRHPTFIEGPNECGYHDVEAYFEWTKLFTALAHAKGYQVAGFSYGVGWPSENDWFYLADHGFAGVDVMALHCYWKSAGPTEYYEARRFQYLTDILEQRSPGLWQPAFLITECGREPHGWKANGQSAPQAAEDFATYDRVISVSREHAPFQLVKGAAAFTTNGPPDFTDFSIEALAPVIWPSQIGTRPCTVTCNPGTHCNPDTGVCENDGPAPVLIPGLPLPVAIAGGIGLAALIYALVNSGTVNEIVRGVSDIQVIDAGSPIPPGYFPIEL